MVEVDFEVEEYLETYINYTGNYMDSWYIFILIVFKMSIYYIY